MDPIIQPPGRIDQSDSDADITKLLYKSGRAVKQGIKTIYLGVKNLFQGILLTFLFLLRNFIWIILATVLGLGYGIYLLSKNGSKYQSQMIVKTNFNSSRSLYNTIDYLNAVRSNGELKRLSAIFNIPPSEVALIENFSIEPVESEIITAEMYKKLFLSNDREISKIDTAWLRTISYNEFKRSITKYDYPYYEISVIATNPTIFAGLKDGIIKQVSEIPLLKEARNNQISINIDEEKLFKEAMLGIDTLRQVYNVRLANNRPSGPENNQLTITQSMPQTKTPELDLYDKLFTLQDELTKTRNRAVSEKNVIEIYSPFNSVGQKVSFIRQSVVKYGMYGFTLSIVTLLIIALYRILIKLEKTKQIAKG
jgi:hypothetical protein